VIKKTDISFGPDSRSRQAEALDPSAAGAEAALKSFYYALNNRDADALRANWSADPLAQLNNPAGGILRGGDAIAELHRRVFSSPANVRVTFSDVIAYLGDRHAVFAGRETGSYSAPDGTSMPLEIRTSRYFRYKDRQCRQYHHHGSIDDPDASAPNSAPSAPDAQIPDTATAGHSSCAGAFPADSTQRQTSIDQGKWPACPRHHRRDRAGKRKAVASARTSARCASSRKPSLIAASSERV
jgi:ketosteroid isomerase-like protein